MEQEYKELLEKSIVAWDNARVLSEKMLECNQTLSNSVRILNDSFVLHNRDQQDVKKVVEDVKTILIRYLKWAIIVLIAAVGGTQLIQFFLNNGFKL